MSDHHSSYHPAVLSKKKKGRTLSLATATKAIAVRETGDLQTAINGVGEKQNGEHWIKFHTRNKTPVSLAAMAVYYGVKRKEVVIEKQVSSREETVRNALLLSSRNQKTPLVL